MLHVMMRSFPWTVVGGTITLLSGLIWDVWLHQADPALAMREGVFTLSNPSHMLLIIGIASIVLGVSSFLVGRIVSAHSHQRRIANFSLLFLVIALSGTTATAAALGNQQETGHGHVEARQHSHP